MKNMYKLAIILLVIPMLAMAQAPNAVIKRLIGAPTVDGQVDAFWSQVTAYNVDKKFTGENPTLGDPGTTTWQAVYNDTAIFVLLKINDDVFSPAYAAGAHSGEHWMYDKPEVYFDVNSVLADGLGASAGKGHFQVAPAPRDGFISGELIKEGTDVYLAYNVADPAYVVEYSIPFAKLIDKDGNTVAKTAVVGFDVTVCDNDLADGGATAPVRNRAVWANIGGKSESWNNLDDAGTITFSTTEIINLSGPSAVLKKLIGAPLIDGVVDAFWANVPANNIDKKFTGENPTLGDPGTTTWQAVYNDTAIFVLLKINDDVFSPAYAAGAHSGEHWMYDKPEVYFDVNAVLADGIGASSGKGHFQVAPAPRDGFISGELIKEGTDVYLAYNVADPAYVVEYSIPFAKLLDKDGVAVSKAAVVGFDVTIVDNDLPDGGATAPARNRAVWANIGGKSESWNNLDDAGVIVFGNETIFASAGPSAVLKRLIGSPIIDGEVDAFWANVPSNNIDKKFTGENPTLGDPGTTTWQAVYNDTAIFVLLKIEDDVFSPAYAAGAHSGEHWMYDKPEVYFDVNSVLADGLGASAGKGHFQVAPAPRDGFISGELIKEGTDVYLAYNVADPAYVVEYSIPFAKLLDKDGVIVSKTAAVGFDVTIIDNDLPDGGATAPARSRAVWANIGGKSESWNNLDDAGVIAFGDEQIIASSVDNWAIPTRFAYITYDVLKFKGYDKAIDVDVYSILGQKILSAKSVNEMNVSSLKTGVYLVRVDGKAVYKVMK